MSQDLNKSLVNTMKAKTSNSSKMIEIKKKKLQTTEDKILTLNDSISKISSQLKEQRDKNKSNRVSSARLSTHKTVMLNDSIRRPSDRTYEIRTYTKMDIDLWENPDVCSWFNKDAPAVIEEYKFSPTKTGYSIPI